MAGSRRVFMPYLGGVGEYRKKCLDVAINAYSGFSTGSQDNFQ